MSDNPKPTLQDDVESGSWMTENGHLIVPIEDDIEHVEEEEDVRPSTSYSNKQCIEFNPITMEEETDSSDSVDDDEDWRPPQKKPPKSPSIPEFEPTIMEEEADSSDSIDDDDDCRPPSQKKPQKSPSFRGRRRGRPPKTIQNNRSPTYYPDYTPKDDDLELSEVPVTKFPHASKLGGDDQTEKSLSLRFYEQHFKDQVNKGRVLNRTHMADQIALEYRAFNARTEEEANYYKALQSICNGEELHEGMGKRTVALIVYAEYVKREVRESLKKEGKLKNAISFISSLKLQREPQVIKKRKMKCADHDEFLKNPETNAFGLTDDFFDGLPTREDIERHCSDFWNNSRSSEDVNQAGGSLAINNGTVSINGKRTEKESAKKVKSLTSEEAFSEYTVSECCSNETDNNKIGSVFKAEGPSEVKNRHLLRSAEDASRVLNTSSISNVQRNTPYYISPSHLKSNEGMIHESEANQQTENTKVVDPNTKVGKLEESSFVQNNIVEEALESAKLENLKDTEMLKQRPIAPNDDVPTPDAKLNRKPIVLERLSSNSKDFQVETTTSSKSSGTSLAKPPARYKPVVCFQPCDV